MASSAAIAVAGTTVFAPPTGSIGNQSWFTATNWSAGVPGAGDVAFTAGGSVAFVEGATAATALNLGIVAGGVTVGDFNVGALNVGGQISVTGGRLSLNFGTISLNSLAVGTSGTYSDTKSGTLAFIGTAPSIQMASVNVIVNSQIIGTAGLAAAGPGTLVLAGTNSYTGGTTVSSVSTVQVGNGGSAGTLGAGDVANSGTLVFGRSDSVLVSNTITGAGTVRQAGPGATVLSADNSYTGGTTISGGALQIGNGGTTGSVGSGAIVDNGALVINRSDDLVFGNQVSGTGSLTHAGTGKLTLTASNSYSGATGISSGTLQVGTGGTTGSLGSGNVANNGALVFNRSDGVVVNGQIAGIGSVTQAGSGTLTLLGSNTYGGGTFINAGTLQVGNGGIIGSLGTGNVTNNGSLAFSRSDTILVANTISGTGGVAQTGTGTVALTANNTYSGATTISSGTLQVGNGGITGSLGSGGVTNNAALVFSHSDGIVVANVISGTGSVQQSGSGSLALTGNNTYGGGTVINAGTLQVGNAGTTGSLGTGATTNNSRLVFNRTDTFSVDSQISGAGTVTQAGLGTTVLTANNTYTGATAITGGTLQVGNGGTAGTLGTGNVANGGALVFNRSDNVSVDSVISGTGSLAKSGGGTLILTAANTYTGTTTINSGTLQVGNGGLTGSIGPGGITNNGRLVFNRGDIIAIDNVIDGSGSVRHSGAGTLTLTATNTFSGGATIDGGGTLRVVNGSSLGTGDVNVTNGTLKPDSTSATTRTTVVVGGNYTQSAAGALELGIGGSGANQFDRIQVGGKAVVGGTLRLVSVGTYRPLHNTKLVIVSAGGGVSGQFSTISNGFSNSPLLAPLLAFNPNDITLSWAHASFQPFAATRNQQGVAAMLDSIVSSNSASDSALIDHLDYDYVSNLRAGLAGALDQIAPDGLTSLLGSSLAVMDLQGDQFLKRTNELLADYPGIYSAALRDSAASTSAFDDYVKTPWSVYLEVPFSSATVKADTQASGYDLTTRGVTFGIDHRIKDRFVLGFSAAYASTTADVTDGSKVDSRSTVVDAYALWSNHGFHLVGMAGGTTNTFDSSRQSLGGIAKGSAKGLGWMGLVGGGYDWKNGPWKLGSQVALLYGSAGVDGFTETGSFAPLRIPSQRFDSVHSQVGLNLRYHRLVPQWTILTPQVYVGWRHELQGDRISIDAQSASRIGQVFRVYGPTLGADSIIGSAGLAIQWRPAMNTFLNFTKQIGRTGYDSRNMQLGGRLSF